METLGFFGRLSAAFAQDGIWMYAIASVHIATIAIVVDRVYALFLTRKANQKKIIRAFEDDIKSGKLERTFEKSMTIRGQHPIAAVVSAGVQAAKDSGGRDEVQARMDEVLSVENSRLEKRTNYLAMLANISTLLGLLGTVVGLIKAFESVAGADAVQKSVLLTKGISLAMNATAYGLIVAIPALVMHSVLVNRTNDLQDDMNQSAFKVFNWLNFNIETVGSKNRTQKSV
jgi:biopolymer transport protein ExbB